jgi:hypothetical protein
MIRSFNFTRSTTVAAFKRRRRSDTARARVVA